MTAPVLAIVEASINALAAELRTNVLTVPLTAAVPAPLALNNVTKYLEIIFAVFVNEPADVIFVPPLIIAFAVELSTSE